MARRSDLIFCKTYKLDLDQKEAALNRRDLSDAELQAMRQGLDCGSASKASPPVMCA
jgi:hypothetical protein